MFVFTCQIFDFKKTLAVKIGSCTFTIKNNDIKNAVQCAGTACVSSYSNSCIKLHTLWDFFGKLSHAPQIGPIRSHLGGIQEIFSLPKACSFDHLCCVDIWLEITLISCFQYSLSFINGHRSKYKSLKGKTHIHIQTYTQYPTLAGNHTFSNSRLSQFSKYHTTIIN